MKEISLDQGSLEWLAYRKKKITGTDAAVIMGVSPWQNENDLWKRKMGLLDAVTETEAMRKGKEMESLALKKFKDFMPEDWVPKVFESSHLDWMACSVDGFFEDTFVEIKCGGEKLHDMAKRSIIPEYYRYQMQHCMYVTESKKCWYVSARGEIEHPDYIDLQIIEVKRDDSVIEEMIKKEIIFYKRMMEFDAPPAKHKKIEGEEIKRAVENYAFLLGQKEAIEKGMKVERDIIESIANGENIESYGLKYTNYYEKGRIDYTKLLEDLKYTHVDIDFYRKKPIQKSRITF